MITGCQADRGRQGAWRSDAWAVVSGGTEVLPSAMAWASRSRSMGPTEAGPVAATERSGEGPLVDRGRPGDRGRMIRACVPAEAGQRAQVAVPGRVGVEDTPAPSVECPSSLPRRGGLPDARCCRVPRRSARRRTGVARPLTSSIPPPKRGSSERRGRCSRASACHPVRQIDPRPGRCRAETLRDPEANRSNVGPEREGPLGTPKRTRGIIAFYPTLVSADVKGLFAPRVCSTG